MAFGQSRLGQARRDHKGLVGLFGVIQIAVRHLRPGNQQLAPLAGPGCNASLGQDQRCHARQGRADRGQSEQADDRSRCGRHDIAGAGNRRLGRAIPVFNALSGRRGPVLRKINPQRLAAEQRQPQLAQLFVGDLVLHLDLLRQTGNREPAGDAAGFDVIRRIVQILGRRDDQFGPGTPADEHVMRRQIEGQVKVLRQPVFGTIVRHLPDRIQIGAQIAVPDRHALGLARAARGEQGIDIGVVGPLRRGLQFGRPDIVTDDQPRRPARNRQNLAHRRFRAPGAQHDRGPRFVHDQTVARRGKPGVHRHIGLAQHLTGQHRRIGIRLARRKNRGNRLVVRGSRSFDRGRDALRSGVKLGVGL